MFTAKLAGDSNFAILDSTVKFFRATYGSIWNFWILKGTQATSTVTYGAQIPDKIAMVGTKNGKGTLLRGTVITESA